MSLKGNVKDYCINRKQFIIGYLVLCFVGYGLSLLQLDNPYIKWLTDFIISVTLIGLVRFRTNDIGLGNKGFFICCVLSFVPFVTAVVLLYLCASRRKTPEEQEWLDRIKRFRESKKEAARQKKLEDDNIIDVEAKEIK